MYPLAISNRSGCPVLQTLGHHGQQPLYRRFGEIACTSAECRPPVNQRRVVEADNTRRLGNHFANHYSTMRSPSSPLFCSKPTALIRASIASCRRRRSSSCRISFSCRVWLCKTSGSVFTAARARCNLCFKSSVAAGSPFTLRVVLLPLVLGVPLGSGVVPVTAPGAGAGVAPEGPPRGPRIEVTVAEAVVAACVARSLTRMEVSSVMVSTESEDKPAGRCVAIFVIAMLIELFQAALLFLLIRCGLWSMVLVL